MRTVHVSVCRKTIFRGRDGQRHTTKFLPFDLAGRYQRNLLQLEAVFRP